MERNITHPVVQEALGRILNDYQSVVRSTAIANAEESKLIYKQLMETMADPRALDQVKDTLMFQIIRIVNEDVHSVPPVIAKAMPGEPELIKHAAETIVSASNTDEDWKGMFRSLVENSCFKEGTSFLELLPEQYKDYRSDKNSHHIKHSMIESANTFCDPNTKGRIENSPWAATRHEYNYLQGLHIAKEVFGLTGELKAGDPMFVYDASNDPEKDDLPYSDKVVFYKYYDKESGDYCVFGGGNMKLIRILQGDDYPFLDKKGMRDFPLLQHDATVFKGYGIRALSFIDVAKDITRQHANQFNQILPYFKRVNNPVLAVTGAMPAEDLSRQLADAEEMQEQGMTGILSMQDPQSRVTTVYPEDISQAFSRISIVFDNALAKRLGVDLNINEKTEQSGFPTATQIVQRAKTQAKAIANVNRINIPFFVRRANTIISLYRDAFSNSRETHTISTSAARFTLEMKDLVEIVRDWRGTWEVDTTIDLELTRSERATILREFKTAFMTDVQITFTDEAMVKPLKDMLWAEVKLIGFDEIFQKEEIDAFYSSIIERNRKQEEAAQQAAQAEQEAMQARTAPQSAVPDTQEGLNEQAIQQQAAEQGGGPNARS